MSVFFSRNIPLFWNTHTTGPALLVHNWPVVTFYLRLYFPSAYSWNKAKLSISSLWWRLNRGYNNGRTVIRMAKNWLRLLNRGWPLNREEKSLRHVAMVTKFPDDNKPKTSLKTWIRTASNVIDLIQLHLNGQMLAKFCMVQRRQRNVQNSVVHVQICCFVNKNLLLFCRSPSVSVVVGFVVIQK